MLKEGTEMNEWTPQEFYTTGSLSTDQPPPPPPVTVYRQYWEDNWNAGAKSNVKNSINGYKIRDQQQQSAIATPDFVAEDVGIPPCVSSKKKQNGFSDPRFKRVINSEARTGACPDANPGKLLNVANIQQVLNEDCGLADKVISYLKIPNDSSLYSSPGGKKNAGEPETVRDLSEMVTRDVGFEPTQKYNQHQSDKAAHLTANFSDAPSYDRFGNFEKFKNNSNSNLKRSVSDCTMNTKNTLGDENENEEDEIRQRAKPCPSATRLSKVHNWMRNYKIPAEKRRSVITVIGQTQSKPFSKILNEINQRRKLAKELDKHALCRAIMESAEPQSDVKNLIAKVDFVLPDGKIIYSTEKIYLRKENNGFQFDKDGDTSSVQKNLNGSEVSDKYRKNCDMIPERDSSTYQMGKRNKLKRSSKKPVTPIKEKNRINENLKMYSTKALAFLFWPFLVLLCCLLCTYAYYYNFRCPYSYFLSDFFRPKNRAWYKKILL